MHGPIDKRVVHKEARALVEVGYDVVHICPHQDSVSISDGIKTITYPPPSGIKSRIKQLRKLYKLGKEANADVYHCNEVDSWLVGLVLKMLKSKKVIFDVHEHYPSVFSENHMPRPIRPLINGMIRLMFWVLGPMTDYIVLAKQSVARDFVTARKKCVLVQNFTPLSAVEKFQEISDASKLENDFVAVHVGLIGRVRGWPQILAAFAKAKNKFMRLLIIGEFNDDSIEDFWQSVKKYNLQDRVTVKGWMPFPDLVRELTSSSVGLVTFQPGKMNHVYALPHKMFDYMLTKLPIIVPDFAVEVAEITKQAEAGLLVDPSNSQELANALDQLAEDEAYCKKLGQNGYNAVVNKYNWEAEAKKLVSLYQMIEEKNKRAIAKV